MKTYNSQFTIALSEVACAVEVEIAFDGGPQTFRIEALEGPSGTFTTRVYVLREIVASTASPNGVLQTWVVEDVPRTHRQNAQDAIDQALSFLSERTKPAWVE